MTIVDYSVVIPMVYLKIIGEFIGRIYDEVKQRPYYIIR